MRFASLGSGSKGNATLVEAAGARVMIDCGFSCSEAEKRLARLALHPRDLDAVLVTHEHSDHISGVARLARRHQLPVWMTAGTHVGGKGGAPTEFHCINSHRAFRIGDLRLEPFPVPHDAREPCQFVLEGNGTSLGLLTDAGTVTPHAGAVLAECDALVLECNHDPQMLRNGPYPPSLQARVGGDLGHLSNLQAAELLDRLDHGALRWLVAAHLSEKNNRPELVRECLSGVCGELDGRLRVASQDRPSGWLAL